MAVYDKPLKSLMFLPDERMDLVKEAFKQNPKIKVTGYSGLTVDFCRNAGAQVIVRGLARLSRILNSNSEWHWQISASPRTSKRSR